MTRRPTYPILFLFALLVTTLGVAAPQQVPLSELFPTATQTKSAVVINKVLERYHYRKVRLDETFARGVLDNYLTALDPSRSFLLARDVERFQGGLRRWRRDCAAASWISPSICFGSIACVWMSVCNMP